MLTELQQTRADALWASDHVTHDAQYVRSSSIFNTLMALTFAKLNRN